MFRWRNLNSRLSCLEFRSRTAWARPFRLQRENCGIDEKQKKIDKVNNTKQTQSKKLAASAAATKKTGERFLQNKVICPTRKNEFRE